MRRKFAITHAPTDPRSGFDDNPVGESRIVEWGRPKSRPPFPATERVTLASRKPLAQHSGPPRRRTWCRSPQRSYTPGEGRAPYGCAAKRSAASLSAAAQPAESVGRLLLAARVALALACLRAFLALMMSFRACCAGRVAAWSMRLTARSSNVVTRAGMASPAHAALVGVGFTGQPLLVHGSVVPVVGGPGVIVIVLTRTKRSGQEPGVMNEPHTFVSSGTRLLAVLTKATTLPSAEMAGATNPAKLSSFACVPVDGGPGVIVIAPTRTQRSRQQPGIMTEPYTFVSSGTRLLALLKNATKLPSAEMAGAKNPAKLSSFACVPVEDTLTRFVVPVIRSWTKTSTAPLVSRPTRLVASLENATKRPSAEMAGVKLVPFASAPAEEMLTRSVVPVSRSRTNTSVTPLVSPGTRLVASLGNVTKRPSAEMAGRTLVPVP